MERQPPSTLDLLLLLPLIYIERSGNRAAHPGILLCNALMGG